MMTPFPPKTPTQMRREAERGGPLRPSPPPTPEQRRSIEAARPQLAPRDDGDDELRATAEWLAHIEAGRIEVR